MSNLQILSNQIRENGNLYSLNDLHLVSGNDSKHRPSLFIRLETTKDLISEISKEVRSTDLIFKTLRGRNIQGTWACEELVLSYAMWISPKFHLIVLRAFLAMHKGEVKQPQRPLPLPEPTYNLTWQESELKHLASFWCATYEMHKMLQLLEPALRIIGSTHHAGVYSQVREYQPTIDFIHRKLQRDIKPLQYIDPQDRHWQYCLDTINHYQRTKPKAKLR